MKIISLELKGAIRLELSGIDTISITPETSIMAIIGSNGSGKSSVLHYLSPNVPDKADFNKGGYKKIRLEHNNKTYCLTSDFSTNKHSFIDESTNEELNIGGTSTMQKQLIKDYFNYNDKIHLLLTGKEKFTQMAPSRRKEWFTTLCDSDYTFALDVFNKAKDKLRDATGALKKMTQHQMQLSSLTTDETELSNISLSIKERERRIEELTKLAPYDTRYSSPTLDMELTELSTKQIKNIEESNKKLIKLSTYISNLELTPKLYQHYLEEKTKLSQEMISLETKYQHLVKDYTELENKIADIKVSNESEVNLIKAQIQEIQKEIDSINNNHLSVSNTNGYDVSDPVTKYNVIKDLSPVINNAIDNLLNFGDIDINKDLLIKLDNEISELKLVYSDINIKLNRIDEKIKFLEEKEKERKISCPNCNHVFHPDFNEGVYNKLKEARVFYKEELEKQNKIIKEKEETYIDYSKRYSYLSDFIELGKNNGSVLMDWVRSIVTNKYYLNTPQRIRIDFEEYYYYLGYSVKKLSLEERIASLNAIVNNTSVVDEKHHKQLLEQLNTLSEKISQTKQLIDNKSSHLDKITKLVSLYQEFIESRETLSKQLKEYDDLILDIAKFDFYSLVTGFISQEREEIANLTKRQMEIITREKNIEMVNKQIEEIKQEILSWDAIVDSLNPQDGLIAEGLLGYIKVFLSRVNGFIKSIWTYPLIIHPAKVSEDKNDELSYRFPMTVGLSNKTKTDISLGSDGILEVIDLAFKMIAMKALGLSGYPIFLDEFGRTFDAKHKENALRLIEKLSEEFIEDQIFIVSHSFMEYSVLNNISFCVLSEENIVLPPNNINKGVIIKR